MNGATNGSPFTISGGDSTTTQVYIPVAPAAATKSLSAVINGSLQVGTSDTATITVKSFNGATLPTLTDDFIGVGFSFNNIIVNSDEVTVEVGLTTATEGAIVAIIGGGASTTVYIPVAPAAATKSLSAGIDGALIVGGEGKATIWVKGFNGATMPSDVLAYEGFSFSVWRQEGNPNESFCDVT
ncbi:hypothetical protein FACS1894218_5340 [Bacilli bacterium]|nr:hypothetical protein FACS1894218_5340 [Bacilli bacterium]